MQDVQPEKNEYLEWGKTIVIAIVLAFLIRSFLFTSYEVRGESMVPNVYDGERLIVNKLSYEFSAPKRFDLIVFHANEQEDYIKRVIGLPGDTVHVQDDVLYINDEPIEEPFLEEVKKKGEWERYTDDFSIPEAVPEGHVFVLGDNRPRSLDSRKLGFIQNEEIVGKVNIRFWPLREVGIIH